MLITSYSYPRSGRHIFGTTLLAFDGTWVVDGKPMKFVPVATCEFGEGKPYGVDPILTNLQDTKNVQAYCDSDDTCYVSGEHLSVPKYCGKRIFIIRNPWDVVLSCAEVVVKIELAERKTLHKLNDVAHRYITGEIPYQNHCRRTWVDWVKDVPDHPVIRFEDMIEDRVSAVQKVLSKIGVQVENKHEPPSLEDCRKLNSTWYNVGIVGRGKEQLPSYLVEMIGTLWKEQIERFRYNK